MCTFHLEFWWSSLLCYGPLCQVWTRVWHTVRKRKFFNASVHGCKWRLVDSVNTTWETLYFTNILLKLIGRPSTHHLSLFHSNVRFRWSESTDPSSSSALSWALNNVYIGPACIYHCSGHGHCINGDTCICDEGYDGESVCLPLDSNPATAKITFDGKWWIVALW